MSLTIVLANKGRPLHTLRWMWHANRIGLPFSVIVTDGGTHPEITRILTDESAFPNLSYRHLLYNDQQLPDFWLTLVDVATKVDTTYTMICDNDDFFVLSTLRNAVGFLDAHPDYVDACATTSYFSMKTLDPLGNDPAVAGHIYRHSIQTPGAKYDDLDAITRVDDFFSGRYYFHYGVTRTSAWREIFTEARSINFRNFDVWGMFLYVSLLLTGRVTTLPEISYARQMGSSETHASGPNWFDRLFFHSWMADYHNFNEAVTDRAARDGLPGASTLAEIISQAYATSLKTKFSVPEPVPTAFRRRLGDGLKHIDGRCRLTESQPRRRILDQVSRRGVSPSLSRENMAGIKAMHQTLLSPQVLAFLAQARPPHAGAA